MAYPKGILALVVFFPLLFSAFAPCHALTIKEEEELGRKFMQQVRRMNVVDDQVICAMVTGVGDRITKNLPQQPFPFRFYVVQQDAYNAFAGPAGYIFINLGLLEAMENEDELAGILAHEIAHVTCRHISEKVSRNSKIQLASVAGVLAGIFLGGGAAANAMVVGSMAAGSSASLAYSRADEMQADEVSMGYLSAAGYGMRGTMSMLSKIRKKQWFGPEDVPTYLTTHPALEDRIAYLDTWASMHPAMVNPPKPIDPYPFEKMHARLAALFGDTKETRNFFAQAVAKNPNDPVARYGLALTLARDQDKEKALAQMEKALEIKPFDPDFLRVMGEMCFDTGRLDRASHALGAAVAACPEDGEGLLWLGRVRLEQGGFQAAGDLLEKARSLRPEDTEVLYYLSQAMGKQEKTGWSHYYLGLYNQKKGDMRTARFHLEKAKAFAKDDKALEEKIKQAMAEGPMSEKALPQGQGKGPKK